MQNKENIIKYTGKIITSYRKEVSKYSKSDQEEYRFK